MPAIRIDKLHLDIGNKNILKELSVEIPKQSLSVLLGANGSGKTSLLRCIAGLQKTSRGDIFLGEKNIQDIPLESKSKILAWNPTQINFPFSFSAQDLVLMGRFPWHHGIVRTKDQQACLEALEKVGMADKAMNKIDSLSSGEKKLISIARSISGEHELILLDEPFANLDIKYRLRIAKLLKNLVKDGKSICCSVHSISTAYKYADYALLLAKGHLIAAGPAQESMTQNSVQHIFGLASWEAEENLSFLKN